MGLKAAVQALKKAEELKAKVSRHSDLLNNSEVWSDHQQLQTVYHQVLVLDLEYALDKKVEQELWTLGFKNHIAALQHLSRDKKNPRRSECQALLSWCLEAASGFYLTLLQELCSAFELDLPFRRRGAVYGQKWSNSEQLTQPHKSSCLYICQYCLVHLGDIARYRSQRKQAESFYRHAILLSPSSGQPYNQLALLEASRGDKLATVFHYVRSIAVKHPFPAAATNLNNTLSSIIDTEDSLTEIHSKLSLQDYVTLFLHVHGLLHIASDLQQASLGIKSLNATLTALVATKTFNSSKLTQMTAINLYALRHATDTGMKNNKNLSEDETKIKNLTLDLLAGAFSAYLLPIYTMNSDTSLLEYCALPAIKLTMDWIKTDSKVLKDSVFTKRLQIWPSLCKLLNSLQTIVGDFDNKNTEKIPLPEDRDMQCFLPLVNAFKDLDFTSENLNQDIIFYNKLRVQRLVSLGLWLSTQTVDNNILITAKKIKNPNCVVFEPATKQPDPTTELLEELKHFNVKENAAPLLNKEPKKSPNKTGEKRSGILKPQGSLEKSREEREQQALLLAAEVSENGSTASLSNSSVTSVRSDTSSSKLKRRQNVAMQALAKKIEENNKQVKFLTEPLNKIKEKTTKQPEIPKPINKEVIQNIEPIRMPQSIVPPPLELPKSNTNPIPMPYNQQNFPRSVPPYFQNNQNIPFHNSLPPPQPQNIGNIPFQRPQNNPFNTPTNLSNHQLPLQPPQNQPFNVPFELPNNPPSQPQPVGYQPSKDFPQYSPWLRDEKLPLPPSNWWTNNQKNLPRTFSNQTQNDPFSNFSFNTNSNQGFIPENLGYDRQFTPSSAFNNMNVWNSGSVQPNLMLMNQQQSMISAPNQQNVFGEMNKINIPQRENIPTLNLRETSEPQNNSPIPGYSLFNSNWAPNLAVHGALKSSQSDRAPLIRQQSLFSGPGPSPLERLLQQQKQLRGPNKEDT